MLQQQEGVCPGDVECPEEGSALERGESEPGKEIIRIPLLGDLEICRAMLPVQTVIIAAMDSFNLCAIFVLLTLLGLLIHRWSRRRLLLLGGTFVFFSVPIYFVFMAAWLNVFLAAGEVAAVTLAAGAVALAIAAAI